ncbi:MAG: hypothetical protein GF313_12125 [Caldithrix sp.]|nr:hypothetical protein [Caldithrix sp.]
MKRSIFFIVMWFVFASAEITVRQSVAPGIIHYHDFIAEEPWHINILEVHLDSSDVGIRTCKAKDRLFSLERTSRMVLRKQQKKINIVAAINGDFFEKDGSPVNAQVIDGIPISMPFPRSVFMITAGNKPLIDIVSFKAKMIVGQSSYPIAGVNQERGTNDLILFNKYYGDKTGTNHWGREIILKPVKAPDQVKDTLRFDVKQIDGSVDDSPNNVSITDDHWIVSGHGRAAQFLSANVEAGRQVMIVNHFPPVKQPVMQMIGGMPRLVRNGSISVEWQEETAPENFTYNRHPRTAVGYNRQANKVFFFTVDGRQPGYSMGMTLPELAQYLIEQWDIYQALNLDGGGSTTMVVGDSLVNQPSDLDGERPVSNALLIFFRNNVDPLHSDKHSSSKVNVKLESWFDCVTDPVCLGSSKMID